VSLVTLSPESKNDWEYSFLTMDFLSCGMSTRFLLLCYH